MPTPSATKSTGLERTRNAVERQLRAMGSPLYEIGLFRPATGDGQPEMLPRTWDAKTIMDSLSWLRWQNSQGRNIYIRPAGEHHLSLIDDLAVDAVKRMKEEGFTPTLVVETSPRNFQAWVNHGEVLPKALSTAAARELADRFGGDKGAADWRHFGRLSGFTNRKPSRQLPNGFFPFVRLIDAGQNAVYLKARNFIGDLRDSQSNEAAESALPRTLHISGQDKATLNIDDFRRNPKYDGDGNRVDLAYAIYALSHGVGEGEIRSAIASRDLSKKGSKRRQEDYVRRTLQKAQDAVPHTRSDEFEREPRRQTLPSSLAR